MKEILSSALFWLAITFAIFQAADWISQKSKRHPLSHPVLLTTPVVIALLLATGTPYATYLHATQFLMFLLGPTIVGLGVQIWARRALIRQMAWPIALALVAGAVTAIVSAVGILSLFGAPMHILASIAPRATTTPVAMEVSALLGGIPALAAVIVFLSGVVGAMSGTLLFNRMKIWDYRARGFAVGISAHAFGTARAFQVDPVAGSFASLAMALNAIATAILLSLLAFWF